MLTKDDITAIRKADMLSIHLSSRNPQGLVRLIKRKKYNAGPFETDQEHIVSTVRVRIETSRGMEALASGAAQCFELVYIYHEQNCPASSILRTLRIDDEVTFSFYPDCHSNGYVAAAGLHADSLYMHVRRGDKCHSFELATSICPENSARMCRGVPNSRDYEGAAAEIRKLA